MIHLSHIQDRVDGISQAELKARLSYDPETGIFIWLPRDRVHFKTDNAWRRWNTRHAGKPAGHIDSQGYCNINIGYRIYKAHRLAWLYMTGAFPDGLVVHKNGLHDENQWANLQLKTAYER